MVKKYKKYGLKVSHFSSHLQYQRALRKKQQLLENRKSHEALKKSFIDGDSVCVLI